MGLLEYLIIGFCFCLSKKQSNVFRSAKLGVLLAKVSQTELKDRSTLGNHENLLIEVVRKSLLGILVEYKKRYRSCIRKI